MEPDENGRVLEALGIEPEEGLGFASERLLTPPGN